MKSKKDVDVNPINIIERDAFLFNLEDQLWNMASLTRARTETVSKERRKGSLLVIAHMQIDGMGFKRIYLYN